MKRAFLGNWLILARGNCELKLSETNRGTLLYTFPGRRPKTKTDRGKHETRFPTLVSVVNMMIPLSHRADCRVLLLGKLWLLALKAFDLRV